MTDQEWLSGERKKLQQFEAGGASDERIQAEEDHIDREAEQWGAKLDVLGSLTGLCHF